MEWMWMGGFCKGELGFPQGLSSSGFEVTALFLYCSMVLSLVFFHVFRYKKLEDLLEKSFSLVKMPSIQPVVMCVMKHLPKVGPLHWLAWCDLECHWCVTGVTSLECHWCEVECHWCNVQCHWCDISEVSLV